MDLANRMARMSLHVPKTVHNHHHGGNSPRSTLHQGWTLSREHSTNNLAASLAGMSIGHSAAPHHAPGVDALTASMGQMSMGRVHHAPGVNALTASMGKMSMGRSAAPRHAPGVNALTASLGQMSMGRNSHKKDIDELTSMLGRTSLGPPSHRAAITQMHVVPARRKPKRAAAVQNAREAARNELMWRKRRQRQHVAITNAKLRRQAQMLGTTVNQMKLAAGQKQMVTRQQARRK